VIGGINNLTTGNLFINGSRITGGSSSQWTTVTSSGNIYFQGNVGINKADPQSALDVYGNILCAGNIFATAVYVSSDYRLKGNIQPISMTKTVDLLKPVEYDHRSGHQIGFIAHEMQKEYPFLVSGEKDGPEYQTVNYSGLIALLVKEIQQLKERMKHAEETIQQLLQR